MANLPNSLHRIVGEPLTEVAFVLDYVEFHWTDKVLRAFTSVSVLRDGTRSTFPQPDSRDVLCSCIGKKVVKFDEGAKKIVLTLDDGAQIVVPLTGTKGPEAVHFVIMRENIMEVWNSE